MNKKRFAVQVFLPDYCTCSEETLDLGFSCPTMDGTSDYVYIVYATDSVSDARKFVKARFPDAVKVHVREL